MTTSYDVKPELEDKAKAAAQALGATWTPRNRRSIAKLIKTSGAKELLVVASDGLHLHTGPGRPLRFHPGMAFLRVERLLRGERDPLIEATAVRPGDSVLDCTAGLAADAIVFAHAVGDEGSVVALESEKALCFLVAEGLKRHRTESEAVNAAMRRIELRCVDHRIYLREQPSKSVDVVYFDPMFRRPITASPGMEPLRDAANPSALTVETIEQAARVARRAVVVKEHAGGGEWERLGFANVTRTDGKIAYGVMQV